MDEALGMRAGPLPRGVHALVEDEIAAGGGFVLAHPARARARASRRRRRRGGRGGRRRASRVAARLPRVRGAGLRASRAGDGQAGTQPPRGRLERGAGGRRRAHDALRVVPTPGVRARVGGRWVESRRTRDARTRAGSTARGTCSAPSHALGDDDDDGDAVVVFDSLNALADGEPTAADADRAVRRSSRPSSLRRGSTAVVALAHRDACARDGLRVARRRASPRGRRRELPRAHHGARDGRPRTRVRGASHGAHGDDDDERFGGAEAGGREVPAHGARPEGDPRARVRTMRRMGRSV